jgi:hypothetical protein
LVELRSGGVFWVLACPFGEGLRGGCCEGSAGEDPGAVRQGLDGFDLSGLGCKPQRLWRDFQDLGGIAEVEPWLDPILGGFEHGDAVVRSH